MATSRYLSPVLGHFVLGVISADGVEISELYHLNNTYNSTPYLYRTRYNENAAFEHSDLAFNHFHCSLVVTVVVNFIKR